MESLFLGGLQESGGEGGLRQGLSPGYRHAAAGIFVKDFILHDFLQDFFHRLVLARKLQGTGVAFLGAGTTAGTVGAVVGVAGFVDFMAPLGTIHHAPPTSHALGGGEEDFLLHTVTFRIVAPQTPKGTPLQEYRGADSRPVVYREFLNIENDAAFHTASSLSGGFFLLYHRTRQLTMRNCYIASFGIQRLVDGIQSFHYADLCGIPRITISTSKPPIFTSHIDTNDLCVYNGK